MKLKCNSCDGLYSDSLDVRFTKACDNACGFCIERKGLGSLGPTNVDAMIKSTISSGKSTILILGGEPFLQIDKLHAYVNAIRPHVKSIYITTSLPVQLDVTNPKVLEILNWIDGLNVSIQHYDPKINNEILIARSGHDRIKQLESILTVIHPSLVRVSINLVKGFIDTKAKLLECLNVMKSIGVTYLKINELQSSDLYVSYEDLMNTKLHSPFSGGCQHPINLDKDLRVILKRSCFKVEESLYPSLGDIAKLLYQRLAEPQIDCTVLYEDGTLSEGWITE
jgi:pyruvate-formate lyase-activating enzyme